MFLVMIQIAVTTCSGMGDLVWIFWRPWCVQWKQVLDHKESIVVWVWAVQRSGNHAVMCASCNTARDAWRWCQSRDNIFCGQCWNKSRCSSWSWWYKLTTTNVSTVQKLQLTHSADQLFGSAGHKHTAHLLDLAILKLFCVACLPPTFVDYPEWKDLFHVSTPNYTPASRTHLMDDCIMSKQERVQGLQIAELKGEDRLTCSFDGGSIWGGDSFYMVHVMTPAQCVMLLEGQECAWSMILLHQQTWNSC